MFIYLPIQLFYKEKKLLFILLVLCPFKIFIFHTIILLTTYSYLFSRLILRGFSGFYEWDHHVFQECVEMSGNWDNGRLWINGINGILFHIALCAEEEEEKGGHHTRVWKYWRVWILKIIWSIRENSTIKFFFSWQSLRPNSPTT